MTSLTGRHATMPFFLSALFLPCVIGFTPRAALAQDAEPFLSLGETRELHSAVLGERREIIVGLPAGYEGGDETYPVVYLLDGPSHFHHTTGTARFLARNGRMPEVIVVAIPNTDRTRDLSPPIHSDASPARSSAGGADSFLEFISAELRPFVDEHYRTRPYAILIGHSLGGLFANHALVHRPEVFDAYISISPSLWWDEQRLVAQADSAFDHAGDLVGDFYMTMGQRGRCHARRRSQVRGPFSKRRPPRTSGGNSSSWKRKATVPCRTDRPTTGSRRSSTAGICTIRSASTRRAAWRPSTGTSHGHRRGSGTRERRPWGFWVRSAAERSQTATLPTRRSSSHAW